MGHSQNGLKNPVKSKLLLSSKYVHHFFSSIHFPKAEEAELYKVKDFFNCHIVSLPKSKRKRFNLNVGYGGRLFFDGVAHFQFQLHRSSRPYTSRGKIAAPHHTCKKLKNDALNFFLLHIYDECIKKKDQKSRVETVET